MKELTEKLSQMVALGEWAKGEMEKQTEPAEPEEVVRWKPEIGEKYWFVNSAGGVIKVIWRNDEHDAFRYDTGNCFRTEEEAKRHRDKLILIQELKDFAGDQSWIDWGDNAQYKFGFTYDHESNQWSIMQQTTIQFWLYGSYPDYSSIMKAKEYFGDRLNLLL